jgi:hypothetical protein
VLADREVILEAVLLLDLTGEHAEQPRLRLVHHDHRVTLVLVDDRQQRRDVRLGLERQVVRHADAQELGAPELVRHAREDDQALAPKLLAFQPAVNGRRFGRQLRSRRLVEPLARVFHQVCEHDPVGAAREQRGIEVQVDAEHPGALPVERFQLLDLFQSQHGQSSFTGGKSRCGLHLDHLALIGRRSGHADLQDPVLEGRVDVVGVDLRGEFEHPGHRSHVLLALEVPAARFVFARLPARGDLQPIDSRLDGDVFRREPRNGNLDHVRVAARGFIDVGGQPRGRESGPERPLLHHLITSSTEN